MKMDNLKIKELLTIKTKNDDEKHIIAKCIYNVLKESYWYEKGKISINMDNENIIYIKTYDGMSGSIVNILRDELSYVNSLPDTKILYNESDDFKNKYNPVEKAYNVLLNEKDPYIAIEEALEYLGEALDD